MNGLMHKTFIGLRRFIYENPVHSGKNVFFKKFLSYTCSSVCKFTQNTRFCILKHTVKVKSLIFITVTAFSRLSYPEQLSKVLWSLY